MTERNINEGSSFGVPDSKKQSKDGISTRGERAAFSKKQIEKETATQFCKWVNADLREQFQKGSDVHAQIRRVLGIPSAMSAAHSSKVDSEGKATAGS